LGSPFEIYIFLLAPGRFHPSWAIAPEYVRLRSGNHKGELSACIRVRVSDHAEQCVGHVIPGVEGVRHEYYEEKNDALTEADLGKVQR
jgi:hypothetical protein